MHPDKREQETIDFLQRMRSAIESGRFIYLDKRSDHQYNYETMVELQYTLKDVYDEFMSLTPKERWNGPMPDNNGNRGNFWEFKRIIDGRMIYMKVMEANFGGNFVAYSFHFDRR